MIDARILAARGLTLRAACAEDVAFERALFESARRDGILLSTAFPQAARKLFLDQQFHFQTTHYARAHPHAVRMIVVAGGAPIGRLIVDRGADGWCVVDIALVPRARGKGLGSALLQGVLDAAARNACTCVSLTVEANNRARRLYERLGFTVVEENGAGAAMRWRPTADQLKTA